MKKIVTCIESVGRRKVCDISVEDAEHYVLENGVITHNTGNMYSSDAVFIIGRQQEKNSDNEVTGYDFIINVEKSRFAKEKSKIPISVSYSGGINRYSGLLEMALESGHVTNAKKGWYATVDMETGEVGSKNYRKADTNNADFWNPILLQESFQEWITANYALGQIKMITDEEIGEAYDDV